MYSSTVFYRTNLLCARTRVLCHRGFYAGLMRKSYAGLMRGSCGKVLCEVLCGGPKKWVARGPRSRDKQIKNAPEVLVKSYARSYAGLQNPCRGVDRNPKVTHEMETGDPWYDFWSYAGALCHQDLFRKWQVLCHQDLHKTLHKTFVCIMPCAGSCALGGFPA